MRVTHDIVTCQSHGRKCEKPGDGVFVVMSFIDVTIPQITKKRNKISIS